jgi:hypothetical protein
MAMETYRLLYESRIAGDFIGYVRGAVHELTNGDRWLQDDPRCEYVYRECPRVRVLRDAAGYLLDVDGTDGVVRVVRDRVSLQAQRIF